MPHKTYTRFYCALFGLYMMTSSNGNIFCVTGHLCGEFTGPRWIPRKRPVTRSFNVSLTCVWISDWVNNRETGDLRRHRANFVFIVMNYIISACWLISLIARFMGPTWGPSGADRTQVGPMLAPWTLLSGMIYMQPHPAGSCHLPV